MKIPKHNSYDVLRVPRGTSDPDVLKKAYREQIKRWYEDKISGQYRKAHPEIPVGELKNHPDYQKVMAEAKLRNQYIVEAGEILLNPTKKALYDARGHNQSSKKKADSRGKERSKKSAGSRSGDYGNKQHAGSYSYRRGESSTSNGQANHDGKGQRGSRSSTTTFNSTATFNFGDLSFNFNNANFSGSYHSTIQTDGSVNGGDAYTSINNATYIDIIQGNDHMRAEGKNVSMNGTIIKGGTVSFNGRVVGKGSVDLKKVSQDFARQL